MTFKIEKPELFKNLYWGRPDHLRDDENREHQHIYDARNQLVRDYKIIRSVKPPVVRNIRICENEFYVCEDGRYLVVCKSYKNLNSPDEIDYLVESFECIKIPNIYNTIAISHIKIFENKLEFDRFFALGIYHFKRKEEFYRYGNEIEVINQDNIVVGRVAMKGKSVGKNILLKASSAYPKFIPLSDNDKEYIALTCS